MAWREDTVRFDGIQADARGGEEEIAGSCAGHWKAIDQYRHADL
jgi:hypothetical protein